MVTDKVTAFLTMTSACLTLLVQGSPRSAGTTLLWLLPVMLLVGGLVNLGALFALKYKQERDRRRAPSGEGEASNGNANAPAAVSQSPLTQGDGDTYSQVRRVGALTEIGIE